MEPEDFLNQYESALATQTWGSVSPLIHEDACVVFNSGTHRGKSEIRKVFEKNFSLIKDETYSISNVHWIQRSELFAVFIFDFHWTGIIDGKPGEGSGRGTSVIVNQSGNWQLILEHLGPDVPNN